MLRNQLLTRQQPGLRRDADASAQKTSPRGRQYLGRMHADDQQLGFRQQIPQGKLPQGLHTLPSRIRPLLLLPLRYEG